MHRCNRLSEHDIVMFRVTYRDHGGRTQVFGGKASEPETYRPVEKRNFYLPDRHFGTPVEGDSIGIS